MLSLLLTSKAFCSLFAKAGLSFVMCENNRVYKKMISHHKSFYLRETLSPLSSYSSSFEIVFWTALFAHDMMAATFTCKMVMSDRLIVMLLAANLCLRTGLESAQPGTLICIDLRWNLDMEIMSVVVDSCRENNRLVKALQTFDCLQI